MSATVGLPPLARTAGARWRIRLSIAMARDYARPGVSSSPTTVLTAWVVGGGPARHRFDRDGDDRSLWSGVSVLRVLGGKQADRTLGVGLMSDDVRDAVDTNPPQARPVVFVVVDENTYTGIPRDVAHTLQVAGSLGFLVDGEVEVFVIVRKSDGNYMGQTARSAGGEARDPGLREPPSHRRRVHRRKYR